MLVKEVANGSYNGNISSFHRKFSTGTSPLVIVLNLRLWKIGSRDLGIGTGIGNYVESTSVEYVEST